MQAEGSKDLKRGIETELGEVEYLSMEEFAEVLEWLMPYFLERWSVERLQDAAWSIEIGEVHYNLALDLSYTTFHESDPPRLKGWQIDSFQVKVEVLESNRAPAFRYLEFYYYCRDDRASKAHQGDFDHADVIMKERIEVPMNEEVRLELDELQYSTCDSFVVLDSRLMEKAGQPQRYEYNAHHPLKYQVVSQVLQPLFKFLWKSMKAPQLVASISDLNSASE